MNEKRALVSCLKRCPLFLIKHFISTVTGYEGDFGF